MVYDHPHQEDFRGHRSNMRYDERLVMCMDHIKTATPFCKTWKFQEGKSAFSKCQCLQILQDTTGSDETDTEPSDAYSSVVHVNENARKYVALYMMWFFQLTDPH